MFLFGEHLQFCTFRKLILVFIFSVAYHRHTVQKKMSKRKAENDSKREFNEQWENELLFIAGLSRKPLCIVCENTFSQNRRHDLNRYYKTQHQTAIEEKLTLALGFMLRKEYVTGKKEEIRRKQNVFTKRSCESLAITEASYEISLALAKKGKLSLTKKKLPSLVSRYLQEVWVIKVLKGKQMKLRFPSSVLRGVPRNSPIMCLSN